MSSPRPRTLILAILVGAAAGLAAHAAADGSAELAWIVKYVSGPIGSIFLRLLFMLAIPIIFSAVVVGVCELDISNLGRIGLKTLAYTTVVSLIAVLIGLALVTTVKPGAGDNAEVRALAEKLAKEREAEGRMPKPPAVTGVQLVVEMVPDNPVRSAATGDMIGILVFALALGIGLTLTRTAATTRLLETIQGLYEVSMRLIEGVFRVAPIGVAALLFTSMATFGYTILEYIGLYVGVVLLGLAIHMFVVYPIALVVLARRHPWKFFADVKLAITTAFATSSSTATLPTSLKVAEENLHLPPTISKFVLTAGASMNQNGTALFEGVTVIFLAQLFGADLTFSQQIAIMVICVLGGIGTAGIPGGSLPVVAMILVMFDIPKDGLALILGVDRLLDMCRTTLNVTGDLVAAVYVARDEAALASQGSQIDG